MDLTRWLRRGDEARGEVMFTRTEGATDGPARVTDVQMVTDDERATVGITVSVPDGKGGMTHSATYWLSVKQSGAGDPLSVRAWREPLAAPAGEEIIIENPAAWWWQ